MTSTRMEPEGDLENAHRPISQPHPYPVDEEKASSRSSLSTPKEEQKAETNNGAEATENTPAPPPTEPVNPMHPSAFPDGGIYAWSCVFGSFFALFASFGWVNCIGIFQTYYETHQLSNYSASTIAWIPSMEAFMMFIGGPIVGKLYDYYGPTILLLIGSFFHVFGIMMVSLCKEYYQFFLAQAVCSPIGASMIFYPAINATGTWFHRRRALAMGIAASGSSLGGILLPIMVQRLEGQIGFPWTMRAAGFLILGCLVITNLTVRSRIPPHKKPFHMMEFIEPFQERTFVLLTLAAFFTFWGMFLPFTFVILQGLSHGMSSNLSQYLVPILNAASIFGRIIPPAMADHLGRFNVMIGIAGFSAILVLALWIPATSNAPVIVFAALFGFGSGGIISLPPALVAQISDVRKIGTRIGTLFAVISFATLTGSPIGGAMVTAEDGKYTHLQIFSGVVMAFGCCLFVAARGSYSGFDPRKKI